MAHTDFASMPCPIARSMSVLGERLGHPPSPARSVLRPSTRFDEFQRHLGIAPNILSARLKSLVEHGMLERLPAPDSARHVYHLTEKSRDFFSRLCRPESLGRPLDERCVRPAHRAAGQAHRRRDCRAGTGTRGRQPADAGRPARSARPGRQRRPAAAPCPRRRSSRTGQARNDG
ncbi:winged helix-turn-helix transcriptional regulator [Cupriavidus basilensis]